MKPVVVCTSGQPYIDFDRNPNKIRLPVPKAGGWEDDELIITTVIRLVDQKQVSDGVEYDYGRYEFVLDANKLSPQELAGRVKLLFMSKATQPLEAHYDIAATIKDLVDVQIRQLHEKVAGLEENLKMDALQRIRYQLIGRYKDDVAKYRGVYEGLKAILKKLPPLTPQPLKELCLPGAMREDLKAGNPAKLPTVEQFATTLVGSEIAMVRVADKATKLVQAFFEVYLKPHIPLAIGH